MVNVSREEFESFVRSFPTWLLTACIASKDVLLATVQGIFKLEMAPAAPKAPMFTPINNDFIGSDIVRIAKEQLAIYISSLKNNGTLIYGMGEKPYDVIKTVSQTPSTVSDNTPAPVAPVNKVDRFAKARAAKQAARLQATAPELK